MSIVERAKELAHRAHAGQVDKAGRPYIEHVSRVAAAVSDDPEADRRFVAELESHLAKPIRTRTGRHVAVVQHGSNACVFAICDPAASAIAETSTIGPSVITAQ